MRSITGVPAISRVLWFACLLLAPVSARGEEPLPDLPPPPQMMPTGITCRWESETGSYIRRKVCRTAAEAAAEQAEARHLLDQLRETRSGNRRINGVSTADGSAVRN